MGMDGGRKGEAGGKKGGSRVGRREGGRKGSGGGIESLQSERASEGVTGTAKEGEWFTDRLEIDR